MGIRQYFSLPNRLEDLNSWEDRWIQFFLRDYWNFPGREERDRALAITMQESGPDLRGKLLSNMSRRAAERYRKAMEDTKEYSMKEVEAACREVLEGARSSLADLRKREEAVRMIYPGLPATGRPEPAAEPAVGGAQSPKRELEEALSGPPIAGRKAEGLIPLFRALSRQIRSQGLLSIEDVVETGIDDEFIRLGLRMIVDGDPPAMVREVLQARIRSMPAGDERRLTMIAAAVTALGEGRSPERVEERCRIHLR